MLNFEVLCSLFLVQYSIVRIIGVEPTWIAPPDPKSGASANFAISASAVRLLPPGAGPYPLTGCKIKGFILKISF